MLTLSMFKLLRNNFLIGLTFSLHIRGSDGKPEIFCYTAKVV